MSFRMILARLTRTAYVMDHRAAYGVMVAPAPATRTLRSEHAAKRSGMR